MLGFTVAALGVEEKVCLLKRVVRERLNLTTIGLANDNIETNLRASSIQICMNTNSVNKAEKTKQQNAFHRNDVRMHQKSIFLIA